MFKTFVGHSNDPDSQEAIAEVLQQCQEGLNGEMPQAGILVAAIGFDYPLILAEIQEAFPGIELIGTTSNGEVSSVMGFQEDSLSLMLFCSDTIEIKAGLGRGLLKDLDTAVTEAVQMATAKLSSPAKLCLTFPEGVNVNSVGMIQALQKNLGEEVSIVGGTSGDNLTFDATNQFFQAEVTAGAIPILLFAGNLQCAHGLASGWQPIGKKATITKSRDCTIYEIDGNRALDFYTDKLTATNIASQYVSYPLAIATENSEDFFLRALFGHDEEIGSMTLTSTIAEGSTIWMSEASRENILSATAISLENALNNYPGQPAAALIISCAARRVLLGTNTSKEYEMFKDKLPDNLPCFGFYAYGEISPSRGGEPTQFHNQTFVALLIGEA
jgi:hypothetical protein